MAFQVRLVTHAGVDRDQSPLERLAIVRDRLGRDIRALGLESPRGGMHHREGVLIFPGTDADGESLLSPQAKELALILREIGGVAERLFRRQLSDK